MPETTPKTKKAKKAAMKTTMGEWKAGTLRSGSKSGPKVTSQKQAVAIGLKTSGQSRKKKSPKAKLKGVRSTRGSKKNSASARRKKLANVKF